MTTIVHHKKQLGTEEQYSLAKILGIWALAAIPMGILSWIGFDPALSPDFGSDPLGQAYPPESWAFTVGLIWQFVLSDDYCPPRRR